MSDYLFVLPSLKPKGGSELASAWMLQALTERGRVTVLTHMPDHDLGETDAVCGTTLAERSLEWVHTNSKLIRLIKLCGIKHHTLWFRSFVREARRQRPYHRYLVSSFGDVDLGTGFPRAMQYLHAVPGHHSHLMNRDKFVGRSLPMIILAWFNLKFCDRFASWDDQRTKENFTIANSYFMSESYRAVYAREADAIVYPPPVGSAERVNGAHQKLAFIALVRADPEKGWEDTVGIVEDLRARGHDVTLTMFVLTSSSTPRTLDWIKETAAANSSWLTLRLNASRSEIDRAIGEHRFGLHCGWAEPYGMAVAEMLLGGCLTGVRESGGQTEIVTEPELRFRGRKDAVEKWNAILSDSELQARLLSSQASRKKLYSRETFFKNFHALMDEFEARYPVPR